jgi:hypothetical protein
MAEESKSSFAQKVESKLNSLLDKVPGLKDYRDLDRLRDQDKVLRDFTVGKLNAVKAGLDERKAGLLDSGGLAWLDDMDRISSRIDRLINTHKFAAYGYSAAFSAQKIGSDELGRLYEYDLGILKKVEETAAAISAMGDPDRASMPGRLKELNGLIAALDNLVSERKNHLLNLK